MNMKSVIDLLTSDIVEKSLNELLKLFVQNSNNDALSQKAKLLGFTVYPYKFNKFNIISYLDKLKDKDKNKANDKNEVMKYMNLLKNIIDDIKSILAQQFPDIYQKNIRYLQIIELIYEEAKNNIATIENNYNMSLKYYNKLKNIY